MRPIDRVDRIASLRHLLALLTGFGLVLVEPACAERTPEPGALDARVRSVPYEADQVVRLTGEVGYALELVFEAGEQFAGLASGDLTGVDFIAQGEHLFLKPRAAGVSTNLTVLTDRRVYRFSYVITDGRAAKTGRHSADVSSFPSDSGDMRDAVLWSVRFVYPPKPAAALKESAPVQPLNERYQFCGARQLKPRRVFDDGVRTTIEFGESQELPAVFVRNPDGTESLVNFTVVGTGLIVHRVVDQLVLRRGSLTGCLRRGAAHGSAAHRSSEEGLGVMVPEEVPPAGAAGPGGEG